jgi:hypothetical protein
MSEETQTPKTLVQKSENEKALEHLEQKIRWGLRRIGRGIIGELESTGSQVLKDLRTNLTELKKGK